MKTRYRAKSRLFRPPLIILQVAEEFPYNFDPQFDVTSGGYRTTYRDARVEDLCELVK